MTPSLIKSNRSLFNDNIFLSSDFGYYIYVSNETLDKLDVSSDFSLYCYNDSDLVV